MYSRGDPRLKASMNKTETTKTSSTRPKQQAAASGQNKLIPSSPALTMTPRGDSYKNYNSNNATSNKLTPGASTRSASRSPSVGRNYPAVTSGTGKDRTLSGTNTNTSSSGLHSLKQTSRNRTSNAATNLALQPVNGASRLSKLQIEGRRASLSSSNPGSRRASIELPHHGAGGAPRRGMSPAYLSSSFSPQPPSQSREGVAGRPKASTPPPPVISRSAPPSTATSYVVGDAVLNPNMPVSHVVQREVEEVKEAEVKERAQVRPCVGARLEHAAEGQISAPAVAGGDAARRQPPLPPTEGGPLLLEVVDERGEESPPECVRTLQRMYGTTVFDVVPTPVVESQSSSFAGSVPRAFAQEILPDLQRAEARAEELAAIRRLIDWTVDIPTAETVPPPSISFLAKDGSPAPLVESLAFTLDATTGELLLASFKGKDQPAEKSLSPKKNKLALSSTNKTTNGSNISIEQVGAGIQKLEAEGLYRIKGLVGLLPGLAEKVGLERVLEYQVYSPTSEMFLSKPYVDSDLGDLVVHLNLGLEGEVSLLVKGFDCSNVDRQTDEVQESSNALRCTISIAANGRHINGAETQMAANNATGKQQKVFSHSVAATFTATGTLAREAARAAREEEKAGAGDEDINQSVIRRISFGLMSGSGGGGGADNKLDSTGNNESKKKANTKQDSRGLSTRKNKKNGEFIFPLTNPHNLRYDEMMQTSTDFILRKRWELKKQMKKESAKAAESIKRSPNNTNKGTNNNVIDLSISDLSDNQDAIFASNEVDSQSRRQEQAPNAARHFNDSTNKGNPILRSNQNADEMDEFKAAEEAAKLEKENAELRSSVAYSPWFSLGSLQLPIGHVRLSSWQNRLTEKLSSGDNEDLFHPEERAEVKRTARKELKDVLNSILSVRGGGGGGGGGSMSRRRSSKRMSALGPAYGYPQANAGGTIGSDSNTNSSGNFSPNGAVEKHVLMRKLILCLLLEENKTSRQVYNDISELCEAYIMSAYATTTAVSGGNREQLQRKAAEILLPHSNSNMATPLDREANSPRGSMGGRGKVVIEVLIDALELAMIASFNIGNFTHCCQYALQRVHAVCLHEQDTSDYFNAAQRDLAELYLWYGDCKKSMQVAEDVLGLSERLHGPNSADVVESTLLLTWAAISAGDGARVYELLPPLYTRMQKGELFISPHLKAQVHIAVAYARPNIGSYQLDRHGLTTDNVVNELNLALSLLLGDGDLAEMDKSFSTIFPSQMNMSQATESVTSRVMQKTRREEKRLRWNLLSLVGSLLIQNGQIQKGIKVIENVVQELVLGQHRVVERRHRSEMAAILWVSIALWRCWAYPAEVHTSHVMLRRMVQRLVTVKGPMHPITAMAHVMVAFIQRNVVNSGAVHLAGKSIQNLQKVLFARSPQLQCAYRVGALLNTQNMRWRHALEQTGNALQIALYNKAYDETLAIHEEDLIGVFMRMPNKVKVRMNQEQMRQLLQKRVEALADGYGPKHTRLIIPLLNLAGFYYLLKNYDEALSCAQRAAQIADPKGLLHVTNNILRPSNHLPASALQQRNHLVRTALPAIADALQLTQILFFTAATMEAKGDRSSSLDCYYRCLALLECAELNGCLASIQVMRSIAKLLYSAGEIGDALGWATTAAQDTRRYYSTWPLEVRESRTLLAAVGHALYEREGSYVTIRQRKPLLVGESSETQGKENTLTSYVELI